MHGKNYKVVFLSLGNLELLFRKEDSGEVKRKGLQHRSEVAVGSANGLFVYFQQS